MTGHNSVTQCTHTHTCTPTCTHACTHTRTMICNFFFLDKLSRRQTDICFYLFSLENKSRKLHANYLFFFGKNCMKSRIRKHISVCHQTNILTSMQSVEMVGYSRSDLCSLFPLLHFLDICYFKCQILQRENMTSAA